ncbi:ubiquinone/menaquinone biosynthesis C-methylase UbiE [Kibdelosporangium banguiense]|uniref:Ubiquinone/menaquinone biosynthesis C-methylase UbiE n=1 Tax=Kibdelosporangium banguiense TaxID=1365924 RepID=A0ABS4TVG2_9PSEU|nr:class I SAM-dependent methyltransferase [Kibdelosporangium banguiense]MBP2328377.1 ubiquinone/menaquinone biosynthesis C-methylase UbiE [Kibdelosporangium banguiense]
MDYRPVRFGLVGCGHHTYPVIDGIPVLRQGRVAVQHHTTSAQEVSGPAVADLVEWVKAGNGQEALVCLLSFPPNVPVRGGHRLWGVPGAAALGTWLRRRTVRKMLAQQHSAQDWMRLFYLRSRGVDQELMGYFLCRFGQPRHLAALTCLQVLPDDDRPVLDLACGFGHLAHTIVQWPRSRPVVGVDRNFFQLWVAKRHIAPEAMFVCADAGDGLPFPDDTFGGALCSDAFHLLPGKQFCLDELRRCTPGGPILLTRVGNRHVEPNEGSELSPAEYLGLAMNMHTVLFDENELVRSYLANTAPEVCSADTEAKWLTIIAGPQALDLGPPRQSGDWPHAAGRLAINPIYAHHQAQHGGTALIFQFPSTWYAFENARMLDYHQPAITLDAKQVRGIHDGELTPELATLVEQFVLIGVPDHYLHAPGATRQPAP